MQKNYDTPLSPATGKVYKTSEFILLVPISSIKVSSLCDCFHWVSEVEVECNSNVSSKLSN